jgi:UPF0755 protein
MSKNKHYSYRSPKKSRIRAFFIGVVIFILLLGAATLAVRHVYLGKLQPVSASDASNVVTIPVGSSLPQIANILAKAGVIRAAWAFEWYVRNDNYARDNIEAGTYNIHQSQSVQQIVTQLTNGRVSSNLVVILPGQRIDQIETALISDGFSRADVVSALNPGQYRNQYPMFSTLPAVSTLEGFLYPDSFAKNSSTQVGSIINESLTEMQNKLTPDIVNGFGQQGLNIYQGVTLASIVEQEVSKSADKPIVAQVFLSRFHTGMMLGSDVTAYYGAIVAGQTPSVSFSSLYNTRLVTGLPPGPISNVSSSSLEAVAHPASTNYLYFVTGDNGTTYYSQTLQQHNAQVQQYCQKLCATN